MLSVSFPLLGNFECGNPEKLKSKCIPVLEAQEYIAVSRVGCRLTLPGTRPLPARCCCLSIDRPSLSCRPFLPSLLFCDCVLPFGFLSFKFRGVLGYCGGDCAPELALLSVGRHLVPHQLSSHSRQPLLQGTSRVVRATPLCPLACFPRPWETHPPCPVFCPLWTLFGSSASVCFPCGSPW